MKFLCVPCDHPMKLRSVAPPDRGSLAVVYTCPECGYEIAMLTNPYETQLVQSLGVRVAPEQATSGVSATGGIEPASSGAASPAAGVDRGETAAREGSKCPFASMIPGLKASASEAKGSTDTEAIRWTSGAEARLSNIPVFVRPMARTGIEKFARERGCVEIDEKVLDAARDFFGM